VLALIAFLAGQGIGWGAEPKKKLAPVPLPLLPVELAWIVTLDGLPTAGGAMDDERIYIPIQGEMIQALTRATGARAWSRGIDSVWPPVLVENMLYVAASDGIHALDPATGEEKWRTSISTEMSAPLTSAGPLLIGIFKNGVVSAFAADDGRMVWTQELGASSHLAPVSDDVHVILALEDSRVLALKLADGSRAWVRSLEGVLNQPSMARDRLFVGTNDNFLYALDTDDGRVAWRWRSGGDVIGISADSKGAAYYASLDNVLRAVNRGNGNQRWIKEIPTRPGLPPLTLGDGVIFEEIVVLTGITSEINAFAAKSGADAGKYMPPSDIQGTPLIDPALKPYRVAMVVVTRDGRALGLRPSAMMLAEPMITPFSTELPGRRLDRERLTPARPTTH